MHNPFSIFSQFSEITIGIFGKESEYQSDEECGKALGFSKTTTLEQVHGKDIWLVDDDMLLQSQHDTLKGDGLITKKPNIALSIRWADCQGFLIYEPNKHILALLHAGWRGMAQRAIAAIFETLDIDPNETFVGITPSICKHCAKFSDPLNELPDHLHPFVDTKMNTIDLQAAADCELDSIGVSQSQRERIDTCTCCDDGYWSWRREKNPTKRNFLVAGISEQSQQP